MSAMPRMRTGSARMAVPRSMAAGSRRKGRALWSMPASMAPPRKTNWNIGPTSHEKAPVAAESTTIDAIAPASRPACGRTAANSRRYACTKRVLTCWFTAQLQLLLVWIAHAGEGRAASVPVAELYASAAGAGRAAPLVARPRAGASGMARRGPLALRHRPDAARVGHRAGPRRHLGPGRNAHCDAAQHQRSLLPTAEPALSGQPLHHARPLRRRARPAARGHRGAALLGAVPGHHRRRGRLPARAVRRGFRRVLRARAALLAAPRPNPLQGDVELAARLEEGAQPRRGLDRAGHSPGGARPSRLAHALRHRARRDRRRLAVRERLEAPLAARRLHRRLAAAAARDGSLNPKTPRPAARSMSATSPAFPGRSARLFDSIRSTSAQSAAGAPGLMRESGAGVLPTMASSRSSWLRFVKGGRPASSS